MVKRWGQDADAGFAPQDGDTPLLIAAHQGDEAVVQVLLQAGANTEATDKVRARWRVGNGGGGEKRGCVSCFLGVLLTGFGGLSNLACGWEYRSSCPEHCSSQLLAMADTEAKSKVRVSGSGNGRVEQSFERYLDVSRGLAIFRNFCAPA